MKLTVVVAAHKPCSVPDFPPYLPVQAGAALRDGFGLQRDDTGDNISEKNPYYCELTALYWAWKNLGSDAVGLVHYRRLFGKKGAPLSGKDAERMLEGHDAILPEKRNYVISDLYSHYADAHGAETLDAAGEVIRELWPEYHAEFMRLHTRRSAHMFNMLIMKRPVLDRYCEWLFSVLGELEKRVPTDGMSAFDRRFFGRVSELLLDVWVNVNGISYAECPVYNTEGGGTLRRAATMLRAKLFGKRYDKSI